MTEGERLPLFGEYVLDTVRGCLLHAGRPVHLRPQAYRALKFLTENRGRLVSKDSLIEEVWEGRAVTDDSLVQCLRDVRQALGEGGNQYLRNERGRGYIFELAAREYERPGATSTWTEQVNLISVVVEDEAEEVYSGEIDRSASQTSSLTTRSEMAVVTNAGRGRAALDAESVVSAVKRHRRAAMLALAALALTAATVVYFTRFATRGQAIKSVAVLPFTNASGDPNLDYLSDGLSESLIDRLSELPGVKVIARSSSFRYKGQNIDPHEVAKALSVEALLTGRVVQRGDDLQVRVELVDTRTATQVWGEQYNRRAADIQGVQEEIAHVVSEKLRVRLSGAEEQRLTRRSTQNTQAYQFYLNGLFNLRQGGEKNARSALDYFSQAVAMDPDFALAWAGIARVHLHFAGASWLDPKEANAKAKAAAQRALELDDALPEAHTALALLKQHEWDWAGAEREYRRAIELNPSLVEAHERYTDYLSFWERHEEALAEIRRAQELDPLRIGLRRREAWVLHLARRYDEAHELMLQTIKVEPLPGGSHFLGFMYEGRRMYEQAIAEHQKVINMGGETTGGLCYLGWALAGAGRRKEARGILNKLTTNKEYVSPAELAALYALLGDKEGAIALLEKAYAAHDLQLQALKIATQYDSLRSDPRFKDLVRRVGLPES